MSGVSSPGSWGIPFNEVPRLNAAPPPAARNKIARIERAIADHDTYKALILRDTTALNTRAVKRLVAAASSSKTFEFKSAHLGEKSFSTLAWSAELEALTQALGSPDLRAPFTLYVYAGRHDTDKLVQELIERVRAERPDVKVVIGRGYGVSHEGGQNEYLDLHTIPWDLAKEALALLLVKLDFPVKPQDAYFWLQRLQLDEVRVALDRARVLMKREGAQPHPEDAELALAEAVYGGLNESLPDNAMPEIEAVEPEGDRDDVPVSAEASRAALRAALNDLGSPLDPYGGVALCRVPVAMYNDSAPQVVDACTDLPVYHVNNLGEIIQDTDADQRMFLLRLTHVLRAEVIETPCVFYLPVRRYMKAAAFDELCIALHSINPDIKLVVATDADRAIHGVDMEWFDAKSLAIEDPVVTRDKHLIAESGLNITPARGHQLLKQLSPFEAERAIHQAQVQRRRAGFENLEDTTLLESAVRTLQSPEEAETEFAEKFLQNAGERRDVKDSVAGIPRAVLQFGKLVKHYAQVKQVVPSAAKTLLLKGPPGTGKTATARALSAETGFPLFAPKSSELISKWVGESANAVYKLFEQANNYARMHDTTALLFIDEIDALLKARGGGEGGEREYERVTNALLECIQGAADGQYERVVVIGATNLAHQMDPAALDRFAIKAEIALPDVQQLEDIFRIHLRKRAHDISDAGLRAAAETAYKNHFSGRIVVHALNQAGYTAFEENTLHPKITDVHLKQAVTDAAASVLEGDSESRVMRATQYLVRDIRPGSMGEHVVGTPPEVTRFLRAIRAYDKLKNVVPDAQRSLLLKGPPGTGKTSIARGIAAETGFPMFAPKSSSLVSAFVGESAERLYKFVEQVRAYATAHNTTAIIFFDEIDALVSQRRAGGTENNRLVNAFLETLQGINHRDEDNVVIIGATNLEDEIDQAMVERFSSRAEVGLPTVDALVSIFKLHLTHRTHSLTKAEIKSLAKLAQQNHLSGRNVVHALDRAGFMALEQHADEEGSLTLDQSLVRQALEAEVASRSGPLDKGPPEGWYV